MKNSERELDRLNELQSGIAQEMAEKKRMSRESQNVKNARKKVEGNRKYPLKKVLKGAREISSIKTGLQYRKKGKLISSGDGWYFVVFLVSVIGDVATFGLGAVEGVPIIGWLIGAASINLIIGVEVVIALLYLFAGHYKEKRVALILAVILGFDILELFPIVTALPGFIGSFLINYVIVLQGRAMKKVQGGSQIIESIDNRWRKYPLNKQ